MRVVSSRKRLLKIFVFLDEVATVPEYLKNSIILTREGLWLSLQITDAHLGSVFLDNFKWLVCPSLSKSPLTVSVGKYCDAAPASISGLQ